MSFPFYKQMDCMDCGPTCIKIVAKYFGKNFSLHSLRNKCQINKDGVSLLGISEAAEKIGLKALACRVDLNQLEVSGALPCIIHWKQSHFVVLYKINKKHVYISDPAKNLMKYTKKEFIEGWLTKKGDLNEAGIALLLEPMPKFYEQDQDNIKGIGLKGISHYFIRHKKLFLQLILGLAVGSILQLVIPFFTQSVVDVGIATRDLSYINLILLGQLMFFIGGTAVDFMRSWILLHISTRINISLLSDFLVKLMKLPLAYFDSKRTGDIMQRMGDHNRIESFLTGSTINVAFSLFNFILFTFLINFYDSKIFLIFLIGSTLYFAWVLIFLKARRNIDFKRFDLSSRNQSATIQLIHGMQEIKLNNCERLKRWEWERIQAK
jgi:ATP-binding cassette, subfamily B, bacterial